MITNKTQGKVISSKERLCTGFFSVAQGLMFRRKQNLVMRFDKERGISLHMWFVFFPIDVLVLDGEKKIVEIKRGFKPFSLWKSGQRGKFVVELGFPGEYEVGDTLQF